MFRINYKKILLNLVLIISLFLIDRISKIYILKLAELNNAVDIYITPYLNLYLIWNKGVAFGLISFDDQFIYNLITFVISLIIITLIVVTAKSKDIKKYFYMMIIGGALGNFFDRVYYSAVPDFIDLHIGNFHWFVFNIADIFITIGVICLITAEMLTDKNINNEKY
jgi:signal peptidase II|tara:strand:+ start:723 stop:1223 length:501 start_codon:yes stop_codon:yes gene_type:complete